MFTENVFIKIKVKLNNILPTYIIITMVMTGHNLLCHFVQEKYNIFYYVSFIDFIDYVLNLPLKIKTAFYHLTCFQ